MTPNESALILLRHGQSTANAAGLFTGVMDVSLTEVGFLEAERAASLLSASVPGTIRILASPMRRVRETVDVIIQSQTDGIAIFDWRLSERNYGALTGRTKSDVLQEFGPELFRLWRRSANVAPPPMRDARALQLGVNVSRFGLTESLADVIARVRECYHDAILPALTPERPLLVVANGNSLRALCAILDHLTDEQVAELNIPTGQPLLYRLDQQGNITTPGGEYLDPATALAASALIAHEGGT